MICPFRYPIYRLCFWKDRLSTKKKKKKNKKNNKRKRKTLTKEKEKLRWFVYLLLKTQF